MVEDSGNIGLEGSLTELRPYSLLQIDASADLVRRADRAIKRGVDLVVSVLALSVLALPFLLVAVAIKLDSPGPVFYRSRRVGFRGRELLMLKFRKMHREAQGIPLTADRDARLTRVGAVLARSRVDELPQLWDVLRGRMSLVGPRPEDPAFVALQREAYAHILRVRPGLTGLSQIAFAEEHKILDPQNILTDYVDRILPQKIGLDTLYARRASLRMDAAVLGWTLAAVVLRKQVAVSRTTGALTLRRRATSYERATPPVPEQERAA